MLTDAGLWNKDAVYSVKANVENPENFCVIVAGFDGKDIKAVSVVGFNETASGTYENALSAIDMNGAKTIKLFAFDSLEGIKHFNINCIEISA